MIGYIRFLNELGPKKLVRALIGTTTHPQPRAGHPPSLTFAHTARRERIESAKKKEIAPMGPRAVSPWDTPRPCCLRPHWSYALLELKNKAVVTCSV